MPAASRSLLVACATLASVACTAPSAASRAPAPPPIAAAPASLTVRELTVVDERGQPRVRIGAPLPSPKGLTRAVKAVGIQLMDPDGREIGGLAMLDAIGVRGLCFDSEAGYEAMCIGLEKGHPTVTLRHDWKERIVMTVEDGIAKLSLHDADGMPRLRLWVDANGTARIFEEGASDGGEISAPSPSGSGK